MSLRRIELQVVATAITSEAAALKASEHTDPSHFADPWLGTVLRTAIQAAEAGEAMGRDFIEEKLKRLGEFHDDLWDEIPIGFGSEIGNLKERCKIVEDRYVRRTLKNKLSEIVFQADDESIDPLDLQEAAESAVFSLRRAYSAGECQDMGQILSSLMGRYEEAQKMMQEGRVIGIESGLKDLDAITLGWQPSDLNVVAARPSVGKSAFAGMCAFGSNVPSLVFSLEMSADQYVERYLLAESGIDRATAVRGRLSDREWDILALNAGKMNDIPVYVDDRPALKISEMRSVARRMAMKKGIGAVYVDYLQLVRGSTNYSNREQEVAEVSRGLKAMAKELKVPVIALAQLNRNKRHDERPDLRDLRESGQIEQDSDVIAFLWRDPDIADGERSPVVNIGIDKNRHGPLGGTKAIFKPGTAQLVAYDRRPL